MRTDRTTHRYIDAPPTHEEKVIAAWFLFFALCIVIVFVSQIVRYLAWV